jgi:hypothetical protein
MYRIAITRIWCYGAAVIGFLLIVGMGTGDPVEGWAVLLETNDFPEGYTDLDVDFVDIERMQEMLTYHGWQEGTIKIKRDGITPETVKEGVEYLMKADENDIVLFYIGSHGGYIRRDLQWNEIFPPLWDNITAEKKVLIIDSCYSESFLPESDTGISIASVSAQESGWAGTPEEGLPIIGFVFTYFFCESMKADISVEEGFAKTGVQVAEYMKEVVYPAFKDVYPPERYNMYDPHPVMIDQYPGYLHVDVERTAPVPAFLVLLGMIIAVKGRMHRVDA